MNLEQLIELMEKSEGQAYLDAVALTAKPQFKSVANIIPELFVDEARYMKAFLQIADNYKSPKVKPIKIELENLEKLLLPFASKDDLRSSMQGIFFDSKNIVATNAHIIAILPNLTLNEGFYYLNKLVKKPTTDVLIPGDENFPKYKLVIPTNYKKEKIFKIEPLRNYLLASKKHKIFNYISDNPGKKVEFKLSEDIFSCNAEFLLNTLTLFLQLGYSEIFVKFDTPSKILMFEAGKIKVGLMPLMRENNEFNDKFLNLTKFF